MNPLNGMDERDLWDVECTYVIGHQRPDTDAVASALGYAWFLTATGGKKIVAARAGLLPAQTSFALDHFHCPAPRLLHGVAPLFAHIMQPQVALREDAPLADAMEQLASGRRIVPIVNAEEKPVGVVTPIALARAYSAIAQNPQSVEEVQAKSCREILESAPILKARERISDHRSSLIRGGSDDFLVTDDKGRYLGTATRGLVLTPPRAQLVLVDHNELGQAIAGADEAVLVAVLDHHRLGNAATTAPIPFMVEPVGSTCTLVGELCRAKDLTPPQAIAGAMLSGILSDTLVFRSPTTTSRDREVAQWLGEVANVKVEDYGNELLHVTPGLMSRSIEDIVDSDRKSYEMAGRKVSIAQVEVTNLQELPQRRDELVEGLKERQEREGLSLIGLMVTDVVTGTSHLLGKGEAALLSALPFTRLDDAEWGLDKIVSRKKQLVPALSDAIESAV
jgi:manganese-dependent inorganic pyrophosphatase